MKNKLLALILCILFLAAPLWATDVKISDLTELSATPAVDDVLPIVDTSATSTKKITYKNLMVDPNVVDALMTHGSGTSFTKATIDTAVAAIGTSTKKRLYFRSGTWVMNANADYSAYRNNIVFEFAEGAVLSHGAYTIKMPGDPIAGRFQQIFSGTGAISGLNYAHPEWFGIDGTADEVEINEAIVAVGDYGKVYLSADSYATAAEIVFSQTSDDMVGVELIGNGVEATTIYSTSTGKVLRVSYDDGTYGVQQCKLSGFTLQSDTAVIGLYVSGAGAARNTFRDIHVKGKTAPVANSMGILLWGAGLGNYYNTFDNVEVSKWKYDISLGYNFSTSEATSTPSNAPRFVNMKVHHWGIYGLYNHNTVETYFHGNFEAAIAGATADVYLNSTGTDSIYNTINESGVGNAYIVEDLCDANIIQVYYKTAETPIVDNNTVERNTWIKNGGVFQSTEIYTGTFRDATGYNMTFADAIKLDADFQVTKTITTPGTTGNQTINKLAGRVNIAAGGTTVTVTNSFVTANSIVLAVPATADATARVTNVVPGTGSFVINTVAVTGETAFNFMVIN